MDILAKNGLTAADLKPHDPVADLEAKLDALMTYQGLTVRDLGGGVYEVVKADMPTGDYTNPIKWVQGMAVTAGLFYWFDDYDYRLEATADGIPTAWGEPPFEQL